MKNRMIYKKRGRLSYGLIVLAGLLFHMTAYSQSDCYRPGKAFREDWKEIPEALPVTQKHVSNADLILNLYGPGKDSIKKSHHDNPYDDPFYIWSGLCPGNWALSLQHKDSYINLSEYARVRWRSKQYGFRQLHILLKLSDGTWLVSKQGDASSGDWRIKEFIISDIEWYSIDMDLIAEQEIVEDPDLTKVEEVGFTDLMPGGKSQACSRLDWIEVYGYLVPRN